MIPIEYYVSNRTALLRNTETNFVITYPSTEPAYPLIKYFIEHCPDNLHFFTDLGFRINIGNVSIESTRTRCYNIYTPNAIYSSYASLYNEILNSLLLFYEKKVFSIEPIIEKIINLPVKFRIFNCIKDKISPLSDGIAIDGKFNTYYINTDNNTVSIIRNGEKRNLCMNPHTWDYKDPDLNEKQQSLLTKALYCLNDNIFFPSDPVLKNSIPESLRGDIK